MGISVLNGFATSCNDSNSGVVTLSVGALSLPPCQLHHGGEGKEASSSSIDLQQGSEGVLVTQAVGVELCRDEGVVAWS